MYNHVTMLDHALGLVASHPLGIRLIATATNAETATTVLLFNVYNVGSGYKVHLLFIASTFRRF